MSSEMPYVLQAQISKGDSGGGVFAKIAGGVGSLVAVLGRYALAGLSGLADADYRQTSYGTQHRIDGTHYKAPSPGYTPTEPVPHIQSPSYHNYTQQALKAANIYSALPRQPQYQQPSVPYQHLNTAIRQVSMPNPNAFEESPPLKNQAFGFSQRKQTTAFDNFEPDPIRRDIQRMRRDGSIDAQVANTLLARHENRKMDASREARIEKISRQHDLWHNVALPTHPNINLQYRANTRDNEELYNAQIQDLGVSENSKNLIAMTKNARFRHILYLPGIKHYQYQKTPYLPKRLYPDVTHNFNIYKRYVLTDVLKHSFISNTKHAAVRFRSNQEWDLKHQPGIPEPGEWALYKRELVPDKYLSNNLFGQAMAAMGYGIIPSLVIAEGYSRISRNNAPDQAEDIEAIKSGWLEYKTGNPWPSYIKKPLYFFELQNKNTEKSPAHEHKNKHP